MMLFYDVVLNKFTQDNPQFSIFSVLFTWKMCYFRKFFIFLLIMSNISIFLMCSQFNYIDLTPCPLCCVCWQYDKNRVWFYITTVHYIFSLSSFFFPVSQWINCSNKSFNVKKTFMLLTLSARNQFLFSCLKMI